MNLEGNLLWIQCITVVMRLSRSSGLWCRVVVGYQRFGGPSSRRRWRQHGPLKRWYPTTTLHGITIQKTLAWNILTSCLLSFKSAYCRHLEWVELNFHVPIRLMDLYSCRSILMFLLVQNFLSSRLITKLHNDELHSLYSSPNIVRRMRWAGHVARMGEGRGVYRVLVGRSEGKRPLGRPRRKWEENIKLDLRDIGIEGANWIRLAQDRVQWQAFVNTVMNLLVPWRKQDIFWHAEWLSAFQIMSCTMEWVSK
jgi:hypothetical protein